MAEKLTTALLTTIKFRANSYFGRPLVKFVRIISALTLIQIGCRSSGYCAIICPYLQILKLESRVVMDHQASFFYWEVRLNQIRPLYSTHFRARAQIRADTIIYDHNLPNINALALFRSIISHKRNQYTIWYTTVSNCCCDSVVNTAAGFVAKTHRLMKMADASPLPYQNVCQSKASRMLASRCRESNRV